MYHKPTAQQLRTLAQKWFPALLRKRDLEQVAFAGFLLALQSNNLPVTPERIKPYQDALNIANRNLWGAFKRFGVHGIGHPPVAALDSNRRCDARCQNATGFSCECACGGANHGIANTLHGTAQIALTEAR